MFRIFLTIFLIISLNSCSDSQKSQDILLYDTKEGRQRLIESDFNNDFYQLANYFQPQINSLYCGIASSVIVLNALKNGEIASQQISETVKPIEMGGGVIEFNSYVQQSFLNEETDAIKDRKIIELKAKNAKKEYDPGLTLSNLADILQKVHHLKVEKIYADEMSEKSIEKFRSDLKKYLVDDKHFILANFDGKVLKTNSAGHISPLGSYHKKSDSVLVMDVALHKRKWYFVSVPKLYEAMYSKDGDNFRGYLIVSK